MERRLGLAGAAHDSALAARPLPAGAFGLTVPSEELKYRNGFSGLCQTNGGWSRFFGAVPGNLGSGRVSLEAKRLPGAVTDTVKLRPEP